MLRLLLTALLPLITPFLVYVAWVWLLRRRRRAAGVAPTDWRQAPWAWILAAGICLMMAVLIYVNATTGVPPGTKLAPPSLVDGVIVPSHPVE